LNFFEHQDQSRRQTRWLVFLFVLAVLAIIAVVDAVLLLGFGMTRAAESGLPLSADLVRSNGPLLAGGAAATAAVIGLASLARTVALRGGGGRVALALGGTRIDPDTRDPLKRRLIHVVEEIALASGIPVPEVYVLEQEAAINAFAAGYTSADAAVAVTRGTLEKLGRDELQGVIAHEFSHIFNGDMRLNIRLMGALFGILMLALIGRRILLHGRHFGRSRNSNGAAVLALALTLMLVGYIGLFFGRWIKASVSRQREFLADASAVQFTRNPDGIAGALKKIALYSEASYLNADTEEVGHMLFGLGRATHIFATHPPLLERIQRIEPGFRPEDLETLATRLRREVTREAEQAAREEAARGAAAGPFDAGRIIDSIGQPDADLLLIGSILAAGLQRPVRDAARSPELAPEVLIYSLLHEDPESRERQLLAVAEVMGGDIESRVQRLAGLAGVPAPEQRLPLMELALPGLRRHPPDKVRALLVAVDRVVRVDQRIEVFEYLMVRMIKQYLWESANPHRVRPVGRKSLARLRSEATAVIAIMARHGSPGDAGAARRAFVAGVTAAFGSADVEVPQVGDWAETLDSSLEHLDELAAGDKRDLVNALIATVTADGRLAPAELELMRAVCVALHVPIPALTARRAGGEGDLL